MYTQSKDGCISYSLSKANQSLYTYQFQTVCRSQENAAKAKQQLDTKDLGDSKLRFSSVRVAGSRLRRSTLCWVCSPHAFDSISAISVSGTFASITRNAFFLLRNRKGLVIRTPSTAATPEDAQQMAATGP